MKPLSAIVISGFLGAGKTTLLNRLLASGLSRRKAGVIVNDFGKLNVDSRLVHEGEHPLLELSNGCVCCSLQHGLVEAVRTLVARGGLDLLVIEASGISVSSALLRTLNAPELANLVSLSNVIAVVDARRYPQVLHPLPVIRDQVVCADFIVLNHCDEVDAATINAANDRLRQENPDAPVVVSEHGKIGFHDLISQTTWTRAPRRWSHDEQQWHAYEVVLPDDVDPNQLLPLADQLPESVERVKGFVAQGNALHVLQKVGSFPATLEAWRGEPGSDARNVLVIIARRPIEGKLKQIFAPCSVRATTRR